MARHESNITKVRLINTSLYPTSNLQAGRLEEEISILTYHQVFIRSGFQSIA